MKMRRRIALLASSAFVMQGLLAALPAPARADDDNMAAFVYWRLPLGGPAQETADSSFGFSLMQDRNVWLASSVNNTAGFVPPPLIDLRFGGDDPMPSLSFSGVDVGMVIDSALYETPGPAPHTAEWILIGAGIGLTGVGICAALECFEGDDDDAPVTQPEG